MKKTGNPNFCTRIATTRRAHSKITSGFHIPSASHLRFALNRNVLNVARATPRILLNRASQICGTSGRAIRRVVFERALRFTAVFLCCLFAALGPGMAGAESQNAPAGEQSMAGAPQPEGISVVGYWTIEVRNPDGTTAGVYHFHNAYVGSGNRITNFMTRSFTPGLWTIHVQSNLCEVGGNPVDCVLHEPESSATAGNCFLNMTITPGSNTFRLSGSFDASYSGSVTRVYCEQGQCSSSTSPDACLAYGAGTVFTDTTLGTPVAVTAGQQVLVTVDFSFAASSKALAQR